MTLGRRLQTPDETKQYSIDYSDWLDVGETLTAATVVATPTIPSPVTIVVNRFATSINFFVSGGSAGVRYKLIATVTTTNGQTKQDDITIEVRAL